MNWPVFAVCLALIVGLMWLQPRLYVLFVHFVIWASKTSDSTKKAWERVAIVLMTLITAYILMKCWEYQP